MNLRTADFAAAGLLAAFLALSTTYVFRIIPGNAPDERAHVEYVLHLVREGKLPVWNWPADLTSREACQPPLYYWLGSRLLRPLQNKPHHLQFRTLRFLSVLFHLGALIFLWRMSRRLNLSPAGSLGPLATAAFLPMFIFIGSSVTNDAAANLAGAALLFLAVRYEEMRKPVRAWLLGAAIGLALLCKVTVLPAIAVALWVLWKTEKEQRLLRLTQVFVPAALLCGWFYFRNISLYGDPLGLGANQGIYDPNRYEWSDLGSWLRLFFQSFWGRFGLMAQPMPGWAYGIAAIFSLFAAFGWILRWRELFRLPGRQLLLSVFVLALFQNFAYGFFLSYQPQARFSFVAIAAWAILFWDGLSVWFDRGQPLFVRPATGVVAAAIALLHYAAWTSL